MQHCGDCVGCIVLHEVHGQDMTSQGIRFAGAQLTEHQRCFMAVSANEKILLDRQGGHPQH